MTNTGGVTVTIHDVAARAGVSKSTVSKYLTSTPYVSAAASERIRAAIEDLGYRPSSTARALVGGRTRYVGVLVPSIANPYEADLLEGIEHAASPHHLGTLLAIADADADRERDLLRGLLNSGADGLIVTSAHADDSEVRRMMRAGVPVVLAGRHTADADIDSVYVDNLSGARQAVEHLIELGHRRIAHVPGPGSVLDFAERAEGYERTMRDHGLAPLPHLGSADRPPHPQIGRDAVLELMQFAARDRPTAVFVGADWIAMGVLAEAARQNLAVPGDLSVVGFDNTSICELTAPPLSTLDGQPVLVGRKAIELLVKRMSSGYGKRSSVHEVIAPKLHARDSSAPLSISY